MEQIFGFFFLNSSLSSGKNYDDDDVEYDDDNFSEGNIYLSTGCCQGLTQCRRCRGLMIHTKLYDANCWKFESTSRHRVLLSRGGGGMNECRIIIELSFLGKLDQILCLCELNNLDGANSRVVIHVEWLEMEVESIHQQSELDISIDQTFINQYSTGQACLQPLIAQSQRIFHTQRN